MCLIQLLALDMVSMMDLLVGISSQLARSRCRCQNMGCSGPFGGKAANLPLYHLVVWNIWVIFPYIGNNITPTVTHSIIFQRGWLKPPTSHGLSSFSNLKSQELDSSGAKFPRPVTFRRSRASVRSQWRSFGRRCAGWFCWGGNGGIHMGIYTLW